MRAFTYERFSGREEQALQWERKKGFGGEGKTSMTTMTLIRGKHSLKLLLSALRWKDDRHERERCMVDQEDRFIKKRNRQRFHSHAEPKGEKAHEQEVQGINALNKKGKSKLQKRVSDRKGTNIRTTVFNFTQRYTFRGKNVLTPYRAFKRKEEW